ncbi:hypothetical protein PLESTB_001217300 [Pleodorina starrii]|uniref:Uncharacterized protein n=1 Tax=Pleodorina starrii TaxID=330485 RepID=A0A9W6BSX1_9CHLO|nr:hypothetical protein PLESTB_001217300 [Pleodorina starrii]
MFFFFFSSGEGVCPGCARVLSELHSGQVDVVKESVGWAGLTWLRLRMWWRCPDQIRGAVSAAEQGEGAAAAREASAAHVGACVCVCWCVRRSHRPDELDGVRQRAL